MRRLPEIEEATLDDLPGAVELMNVVHDDGLVTVAGRRHRIGSQPARGQQRLFKAVDGGRVVGWESGRLHTRTTITALGYRPYSAALAWVRELSAEERAGTDVPPGRGAPGP